MEDIWVQATPEIASRILRAEKKNFFQRLRRMTFIGLGVVALWALEEWFTHKKGPPSLWLTAVLAGLGIIALGIWYVTTLRNWQILQQRMFYARCLCTGWKAKTARSSFLSEYASDLYCVELKTESGITLCRNKEVSQEVFNQFSGNAVMIAVSIGGRGSIDRIYPASILDE